MLGLYQYNLTTVKWMLSSKTRLKTDYLTVKSSKIISSDRVLGMLPNPEIPRATIDKLLKTFENVIQIELIRVRWEEIRRLNNNFRFDFDKNNQSN